MRGNLKVLNPFATNETNPLVLSHLKFSNAQHSKLYCAISLQVLNYSQQAFRNPVYRNYLTKYFRTKINRVSNTDVRSKMNCISCYRPLHLHEVQRNIFNLLWDGEQRGLGEPVRCGGFRATGLARFPRL